MSRFTFTLLYFSCGPDPPSERETAIVKATSIELAKILRPSNEQTKAYVHGENFRLSLLHSRPYQRLPSSCEKHLFTRVMSAGVGGQRAEAEGVHRMGIHIPSSTALSTTGRVFVRHQRQAAARLQRSIFHIRC